MEMREELYNSPYHEIDRGETEKSAIDMTDIQESEVCQISNVRK